MRTALLLTLLLTQPLHAFDAAPWLKDFEQLRAEIAASYANLDSAIHDRKLDLPALRKMTEERIRNAKSDSEARDAIDWFLRQFGDGHVSMNWPSASAAPSSPAQKASICASYARGDMGGIDFSKLPEYTALAGDEAVHFPGGLLRLSDKQIAGVLRIHLFMETAHPELCPAAMKTLGLTEDSECDPYCHFRIGLAAGDLLTAALERRIEALRKAGATALIVDITGNGGGSNWVEPAARVLTPIRLRTPKLSFVKHDHWRSILRTRLKDVEADLESGKGPKALLEATAADLRKAIAKADEACDRSGVWNGQKPECSAIVEDLLHFTGSQAYLEPGTLANEMGSRYAVFMGSQYRYTEGANKLPLYVMVDGGTASSSEYFAAMLKDNGAATIVGAPTLGAGCGFTDGGYKPKLANSGGVVNLPDCIRERADGTNEALSVYPDVFVPWRTRDSRHQRAVRAFTALRGAIR